MPKRRRKTCQKFVDPIRITITCRRCGWIWKPEPARWRNKRNMVRERTLHCASCGAKNYIRMEDVKKIWKHNYPVA